MTITTEIFQSYIRCSYKGYLKLRGKSGQPSDYERMQATLRKTGIARVLHARLENVTDAFSKPDHSDIDLKLGRSAVPLPRLRAGDLEVECDAIEKVSGNSELGPFHYIPLRMAFPGEASEEDKLLLGFAGIVLSKLQGIQPEIGKIIEKTSGGTRRIDLDRWIGKAGEVIENIRRTEIEEAVPAIVLNNHCRICEFQDSCRIDATGKDHLSLIRGLSKNEIANLNGRGIFTVTQFAYTFRPRRARNRTKSRRRFFELQARAIRDKKVYLLGQPRLPKCATVIYLDVEGDPDRGFYYLIGVVINQGGSTQQHSFWANGEDEEKGIMLKFLGLLGSCAEFKLFHYGEYETRFLKKIKDRVDGGYAPLVDRAIENSVNVLGVIYSDVYFPTYSNGLKDIATCLGFRWTADNASGIQSLVWRHAWEAGREESLKHELVRYNIEDCLALKKVSDFIFELQDGIRNRQESMLSTEYGYANELEDPALFKKFGTVNFCLPDMEYINKCSYFDYQREKVTVRAGALSAIKREPKKSKPSYRANKIVEPPAPKRCPHCGCVFRTKWGQREAYSHGSYSRKSIDLSFRGNGAKRWVTTYRSKKYTCRACGKYFSRRPLLDTSRYGHGLLSWVIYFNVALGLPFGRIRDSLQDLFGINLTRGQLQAFKERASIFYEETYRGLVEKIRRSALINADETQVEIDKGKKYVWVFANAEEVVFFYSETREGSFLTEFLGNFKGVLVSDFYAAYDSIDCPQQKCLIHLIRDINDDLLKNPFDAEFKGFASKFAALLRVLIETIDKHGLSRAHLSMHVGAVDRFYEEIFGMPATSEIFGKYKKRLAKNKGKLFTFIQFDGIPWNNNNAEHAIKHLAEFRKVTQGYFSARSLKQYLVLLSIFQTCKYRGINFLTFLLSREKNIGKYELRVDGACSRNQGRIQA